MRSVMKMVAGLGVAISAIAFADVARSPERWEPAIKQFEEQDAQQIPPMNAVLFVGSSSIRLWDLAASFEGFEVINRGFGGSEIRDSIHFFDRIVKPYAPRAIVFYAGDNDVSLGKSAGQVTNDFEEFAAKVHEALPDTPLFYLAIKPSIRRWELWPIMRDANARIAAMAGADPNLYFVDVATPMLGDDGRPMADLLIADGLHLSEKGYALWTTILRAQLDEALSAPAAE